MFVQKMPWARWEFMWALSEIWTFFSTSSYHLFILSSNFFCFVRTPYSNIKKSSLLLRMQQPKEIENRNELWYDILQSHSQLCSKSWHFVRSVIRNIRYSQPDIFLQVVENLTFVVSYIHMKKLYSTFFDFKVDLRICSTCFTVTHEKKTAHKQFFNIKVDLLTFFHE